MAARAVFQLKTIQICRHWPWWGHMWTIWLTAINKGSHDLTGLRPGHCHVSSLEAADITYNMGAPPVEAIPRCRGQHVARSDDRARFISVPTGLEGG